ncbi:MAG: PaaI family thioesterase [Alphaproteobacteria bacterium]|nr:PaaI family thioesterase [Alphaproteobacteria bacterium]
MSGDFEAVLQAIPYARFLGLKLRSGPDGLWSVMPFSHRLVGNPMLPAIHGGVTGAFLENAAIVTLIAEMDTPALPKIINITIEYLRPGRPVDCYASGVITRQGRRVANVRVEAWQEDRAHPIALASAHFLLTMPD